MKTLLKRIREEESPFQPASKEELLKRKMENPENCPHCGEDLHDVGVYGVETVVSHVPFTFDEKTGDWNWESEKRDEMPSSIDSMHCANCDEELDEGEDFNV